MNILKITGMENHKRILLIGDANHQFIRNLTLWLREKSDLSVHILSTTIIQKNHIKYYDAVYGQKDSSKVGQIIQKIRGVRRYYNYYSYKRIIKKLPEFDCIHLQYVSVGGAYIVRQLQKRMGCKTVITIWGSDLYRLRSSDEMMMQNLCLAADVVSFTNAETLLFFQNKFGWERNNLEVCRFGLAPLEHLRENTLSCEECKNRLKWNPEKLAITIGYNMDIAQQHLAILGQLELLKFIGMSDKVQLILPITYGGKASYKDQLMKHLGKLQFEYFIYDTFLSDECIGQIRIATDIMIQLQVTDQFSGSMQEHLYAQNVVITGSWLPYSTLKDMGAWYIEVDAIEDLQTVLPDTITNYLMYKTKTCQNKEVINSLSSWSENIGSWINMYK